MAPRNGYCLPLRDEEGFVLLPYPPVPEVFFDFIREQERAIAALFNCPPLLGSADSTERNCTAIRLRAEGEGARK